MTRPTTGQAWPRYFTDGGGGGGGGGVLAPNPTLYINAGAGLDGLVAGDPVSTWEDQSGNAYDFAQTGSARPTYRDDDNGDGLPFVEFDGSDDFLLATVPSPATPNFTAYHLVRFKDGGTYPRVGAYSGPTGNDYDNSGRMSIELGNAHPRSLVITRENVPYARPWDGYQSDIDERFTWGVFVCRWGTALGQYHGRVIWSPSWDCIKTRTSSDFDFTRVCIGAGYNAGAGSNFGRCDWRALVYYTETHDDLTVRNMIEFLSTTWGVI